MDLDRKKNNFVGECLEEPTVLSFSLCGFDVEDHHVHEGGVDVTATFNKIKIVCECWNWKRDSYPEPKRIWSILKNFAEHPYADWVLITAHKVEYGNFKKIMQNYGVKVVTIGKQFLSKSYHNSSLVLKRLREAGVLYSNHNSTKKKKENKENESNFEAKLPLERIFETSKAVIFCFRTAFSAILNQLKNDTRFNSL